MSGIGSAVAAGVTPSGGGPLPPPPLSISMSNSGGSPVLVSGASGSLSIFGYSVSGGTPPYTISAGAGNMGANPSGKLGQSGVSNPNGPTGTFSMTWGGYILNESNGAIFGCSVVDSLGAFDSTGKNLTVKRTS